jgi:thiosulfate reductase cytochrome b subunit
MADFSKDDSVVEPGQLVRRHRLSTRIWHWTNALALVMLFMSGLMIFNAYPRLHWGERGSSHDSAWLEIGGDADRGFVKIAGREIDTTGVLGHWRNSDGEVRNHAFPSWATIPSRFSLPVARSWHLAMAWVLSLALTAFLLRAIVNGHIAKDLHIRKAEWSPRHIWQDIKDHARLRFPTGVDALKYNILQKLSYISVIFILIPLMIATGLCMSPGMNPGLLWLMDLFGGRQSARSIHFICAFLLLGFFVVHMVMVLLAGPINEVRSIITGWYRIPGPVSIATSHAEPATETEQKA